MKIIHRATTLVLAALLLLPTALAGEAPSPTPLTPPKNRRIWISSMTA